MSPDIKINIKRILILVPHLDDFELGCSGFLYKLNKNKNKNKKITIVIFSSGLYYKDKKRIKIFKKNIKKFKYLNIETIVSNQAIDTVFFLHKNIIKNTIFEFYKKEQPNLILTVSKDKHEDHSILNELTHEVCRPIDTNKKLKVILEYIIPNNNNTDSNFNISLSKKEYSKKLKGISKYRPDYIKLTKDRRGFKYIKTFYKLLKLKNGSKFFIEPYNIVKFK